MAPALELGGGTYHLDKRVFPCRFCNKKNRIIILFLSCRYSLVYLGSGDLVIPINTCCLLRSAMKNTHEMSSQHMVRASNKRTALPYRVDFYVYVMVLHVSDVIVISFFDFERYVCDTLM